MFWKRKKQDNFSEFGLTPWFTYAPVGYERLDIVNLFESLFDSRIDEFISNTNMDEFNDDYMDALVTSVFKIATEDVGRQFAEHKKAVNNISIQNETVKSQIENELNIVNQLIEANNNDLAKLIDENICCNYSKEKKK